MDSSVDDEFVFKPANSPPATTTLADPIADTKQNFDSPELNALITSKVVEFQSKFQAFSSAMNKAIEKANTNEAFEIEEVADEQPDIIPVSPRVDNKDDFDERERELFASMKSAATQFWTTKRSQWTSQHQSHLQQQATKHAAANDMQERLLHAGRDFDLKLFEEVVGACGRGRDSVYGREKMARFWECLLRDGAAQPEKTDDLVQELLGFN